MNRQERLTMFDKLKRKFVGYTNADVENGVMRYCLDTFGANSSSYESENAGQIAKLLTNHSMPTDFESIVELFEFLLDDETKTENGVVFTPQYIADYIVKTSFAHQEWCENKRIIDPGCGAGIFLVATIEYLHQRFGYEVDYLIEHNVYGIDIDPDNARRCVLVLTLLSAKYKGHYENISYNVLCADSLKNNWSELFDVNGFDFVVGNPPYVNPHDMLPETAEFLRNRFKTTQSGVFNIFYAFIEHAIDNLKTDGVLGYIIPNNFLTIKSASALREYLYCGKYISLLLDFGDNMVFRPVRTYNCIAILTKKVNESFACSIMHPCKDIESELESLQFCDLSYERLQSNHWSLVDEDTQKNIRRIENQMVTIKPFIRTGIATLRDAVFMVLKDDLGFYQEIEGQKYYIEDGLVKPIYKVPDLKTCIDIAEAERYIIFPYEQKKQGYALISEQFLAVSYPQTYQLLLKNRPILDSRDKGKPNPQGWYAYGRTQGLNRYGKKLLFPTFSNHPRFILVENENALFCNGYAIFENERFDLDVLSRILNSKVMDYYIKHTSYAIEGGYYCYQKKYLERFSIPLLTEAQATLIRELDGIALDNYLWNLYDLVTE